MLIDNFTLFIDLSSSWTNETVAINLIAKDPSMPILNNELLWNTDNTSFYSWAGWESRLVTSGPPVDQLWRYVGTADGGGVWSQVILSSSGFVKTFRRSSGSGVAIGDTGYYVGGQSNSGHTGTDPDFPSTARTPQVGLYPSTRSPRPLLQIYQED